MARTKLQAIQLNNEWWEELGRATASSTVASLMATLSSSKKYIKIIVCMVPTSSLLSALIQFNSDTSTANYDYRVSDNGAADSTGTTIAGIAFDSGSGGTTIQFGQLETIDISGKEKIAFGHVVDGGSATGAANIVKRREAHGKWSGTARVTTVTLISSATNLGSGSEIIVLGHD